MKMEAAINPSGQSFLASCQSSDRQPLCAFYGRTAAALQIRQSFARLHCEAGCMARIDPNDDGLMKRLAEHFALSEFLVRAVIVRVDGKPECTERELRIHAAAVKAVQR
jgi:hypothetical protein